MPRMPPSQDGDGPPPTTPAARWPLFAILAVAFALRLVYALQSQANPYFDAPVMDPGYHADWARAWAAGETFDPGRPFFRAPLYSWFLGLTFAVFGENYLVPRLIQAGFGTVTTGLCFLIGRDVFGRRIGLLAAAFAATYWLGIYFDGELLIPTLAVPLNLLGVWLAVGLADRPTPRRALLTGIAFGLAAITRPNVLAFMPVLAIWLFTRTRPRWPGGWRPFAALTLGTLLPILPITAYNAAQGDPVLIASQAGVNLWIGNNPLSDGSTAIVPGTRPGWWEGYHDAIAQAEAAAGRSLRASEVSAFYTDKALAFVAEHPGQALRHLGWKLRLFFTDWELGNNQPIRYFAEEFGGIVRLLPLGFWFFGPLGVLGLGLALRRGSGRPFPLWTFTLVYTATVVAFFVCARFRLPVMPPLMIFAAYAIDRLVRMARARSFGPLAACLVAWALLLLVARSVPATIDRSDAAALRMLGNHAFERQDYATAAPKYRAALAEPDIPKRLRALLHKDLGVSLTHLGELDEAERELARALDLQPDQAEAFVGRIELLRDRRQQPRAALAVARTLTQRQPAFGRGHYELGLCHLALGDATAAAQAFEHGLAHAGARYECATILSQIYFNNQVYDAAEKFTRLALDNSPKQDDFYFAAAGRLIAILLATNRRAEARTFAAQLPQDPRADALRAQAGR